MPQLRYRTSLILGPDSLRMHRQHRADPQFIGEAHRSWTCERSGAAGYLMRAAPGTPHPRPKSAFSDAYGWGAWGAAANTCSWANSGHHIKVSDRIHVRIRHAQLGYIHM